MTLDMIHLAAAAILVAGTIIDLRTGKNNGGPWEFNLRRDREEALQLIDGQKPTWVIGRTPCTYFSAWQNINFEKISADEVARRLELGQMETGPSAPILLA